MKIGLERLQSQFPVSIHEDAKIKLWRLIDLQQRNFWHLQTSLKSSAYSPKLRFRNRFVHSLDPQPLLPTDDLKVRTQA
jgi:hypothetical protein